MKKFNKLYLDVCTLCRPYDVQRQTRIRMETDSYYLILGAIQSGSYNMIISPVHIMEVNAITEPFERIEVLSIINRLGKPAQYNKEMGRKRAEQLFLSSYGIADAAHLSIAEQSADFFITCDDKLVRKYMTHQNPIKVMNPIDFCLKENLI
jgi:hypothetical protein